MPLSRPRTRVIRLSGRFPASDDKFLVRRLRDNDLSYDAYNRDRFVMIILLLLLLPIGATNPPSGTLSLRFLYGLLPFAS